MKNLPITLLQYIISYFSFYFVDSIVRKPSEIYCGFTGGIPHKMIILTISSGIAYRYWVNEDDKISKRWGEYDV